MARKFLGLMCAAAVALCGAAHGQKVEEGFVPLFNGKDLTGWKGDTRLWKVDKGEIVGSTEGVTLKHNTFLMTERSYTDFVLRAKVKLRNHNSGIQFRSSELPEFAMKGPQADMAEQTYFGMLYEEQARGILDYWKKMTPEQQAKIAALGKVGEWNDYEILAQGDHIKLTLNGTVTCDLTDPAFPKSGLIGLQLHAGPGMEARFKDISIKVLAEKTAAAPGDASAPSFGRRGSKYRVPDGFVIEQVAGEELTGSAINLIFDHAGRPLVSPEQHGPRTLIDKDGDGKFDSSIDLSEDVKSAQGLYELEKGVYLVQGTGPEKKTGTFRETDTDGDGKADKVEFMLESDRGMGEHGPHAIRMGADGWLYIMFGNHSYPKNKPVVTSPLSNVPENDFLPRWWDPRGHAKDIYAPGGTLQRTDTGFKKLEQFVGGFRNAYDFDIDASGEVFTYDSDMEWDVGLPWYRPCRIPHLISGAEYGWRSGSSNEPFYYLDTLQSVDDTGRGSPVGVTFYEHTAYPPEYHGAMFTGDWSRGRIRVLFPQKAGATFTGKAQDFVIGEPMNVTDMDVGPDGSLYFTTGGRSTHGGLYRVRYTGAATAAGAAKQGIDAALAQVMPRSAWGKQRIRDLKATMGAEWNKALPAAALDGNRRGTDRVQALELMQVLGPAATIEQLNKLAGDADGDVRAAAIYYLGTRPLAQVRSKLAAALTDPDPVVARRACEGLVRAGLTPEAKGGKEGAALFSLLDSPDHYLGTAARLAIMRTAPDAWVPRVLKDDVTKRPRGALMGLLALVESPSFATNRAAAFEKLVDYSQKASDADTLLGAVRLSQIAMMRSGGIDGTPPATTSELRATFLPKFPHKDWRVNRELEVTLCGYQTPEAIAPILDYLEKTPDPAEQIHSVYCLRAEKAGWTKPQRDRLVKWFDKGWEIEGGVSLDGYINDEWEATLELLSEPEKQAALKHREEFMAARQARALALMDEMAKEKKGQVSDLAQRNFQEIAEYLEYDPMAYGKPNVEAGKRVFMRSRCSECHLFGTIGKGGGPDLSTAASRFTRRDMLEAIMYPSKVVSDQYTAVDVEMKNGDLFTGMMMTENKKDLTILTAKGERKDLKKKDIKSQTPSKTSVMPEGLLETMNFGDLVNLIQFLEEGNKSAD